MRIEYDLKFRDVVLFQSIHQFLSPAAQAVFLLGTLLVFVAESGDETRSASALATATTFYLGFWLAQVAFNAVYLLSRKNGNVLTRHTIEMRPDGIVDATEFTQTSVRWPGVARIVSRPGFVAVYISSQLGHVIPNRAFSSARERAEFLAVARQRMVATPA